MYDTVGVNIGNERKNQDRHIEPLHTKRGLELIEHSIFYSYSIDELEQLDRQQIATLELAGELY